MRVPARFDFLVMLALGVLAGFGVARLSAALSQSAGPATRWSILLGVLVLTLLESLPRPQTLAPVSVGATVPSVYSWLRAQDPAAVVAEIPARGPTGFATFEYEYLSIYHWHPLVNGSSGFEPPAAKALMSELDAFPDPTAVAHLRSLGVRYLVAHRDNLTGSDMRRLDDANLSHLHLSVAARFGRDVVYDFGAPSQPPTLQDHVHVELPSLVAPSKTPSVLLTLTNDTPDPLFIGAPEAVGAHVEWNHDGETEDPRQTLPLFVEPSHTLSLFFPAQLSSNLTTAESAQLRVRLTGSIDLEATRTVRIGDLPTSLDKAGLSGTIEHVQLPNLVRANSEIPVEVTARNTGRAIWLPDPPGTSGTPGVVGVSVENWTAADGSVWPPSALSTAHVGWNINPGQATVVTLHTLTPAVPGRYTLSLDMLSENVTWFKDINAGVQTSVPVDVQP